MMPTKSQAAFTLLELMVVIAISITVMAITVPVAMNISVNNRAMRCKTNLQQIHQALKMYKLDEGTVPPYYPDLNNTGSVIGPGLHALIDCGYVKGDDTLHCPSDKQHLRGNPLFTYSYMSADPDAAWDNSTAYGQYNQYQYLTSRGLERNSADPDMWRQLAPYSVALGIPEFSRQWHPDDSTLVLWCYHHARRLTKAGEGQYLALFWDGTVKRVPQSLFRGGGAVPEAWRVHPLDDPTP